MYHKARYRRVTCERYSCTYSPCSKLLSAYGEYLYYTSDLFLRIINLDRHTALHRSYRFERKNFCEHAKVMVLFFTATEYEYR